MSEDRLKKMMKIVSAARKRRFRRGSNRPKYGSMSKAFNDYELRKFFSVIKNPKHYLLFQFQANLGLRIGEAVKVNVKDINIQTRELKIYAPKTDRIDFLLIPEVLFNSTLKYYEENEGEIKQANGYLFGIDENYARKIFREYCEKAGLDEVYTMSEETIKEKPRRLHQFSTHSLRHTAVTKFFNTTKDLEATRIFARHTKSSTTDGYIHKRKEEIYRAIDLAFG